MIQVPHLSEWIDDEEHAFRSPLIFDSCALGPSVESTPGFVIEDSFVKDGTFVLGSKEYRSIEEIAKAPRYVRAGARK